MFRNGLVGGVWLMFLMGFNLSVAVAVGFIARAGVSAEAGVIVLIYLDHALAEVRAACMKVGRIFTRDDCGLRSCPAPSSGCGRR